MIKVLSKETIGQISAGEVIERPMSIVKELVENSIDSGADSISVEIRDGGISFIRVTDNGCGIEADEIRTAFLRHATGKINDASDLESITTLGFRGEALFSIAAVSRVEMITRTEKDITAIRYVNEGGEEKSFEEIGAPKGTTIIVRDVFFNVPARRKFLKSPSTEASHISDLISMLALSHSDIAFKFVSNGQTKLQTSGNGKIRDIVYQIYGRDVTTSLLDVKVSNDKMTLTGVIAKPEVSRSNRNFENYFINGRYVKSSVISKAIEDAYEGRMMQHQFPFAVLLLETEPSNMDVNVHPTKMDVRFADVSSVYDFIVYAIKDTLDASILIPKAEKEEKDSKRIEYSNNAPEPFENNRKAEYVQQSFEPLRVEEPEVREATVVESETDDTFTSSSAVKLTEHSSGNNIRIVGQVFDTYWILERDDHMYLMDQHAAHEKIYFEKMLSAYREGTVTSQQLNPPIIVTLTDIEADAVHQHAEDFRMAGYEIEHFGGKEYAVYAVPAELPSVPKDVLLKELVAGYVTDTRAKDTLSILEKTASMACKAAIKGGQRISYQEAVALVKALFECENPYCCPHGRPTLIEYSRSDIEKLFKRII